MLINLVAFVIAVGLLIVIHEYGHYRVARACGVRVLRFSVGFGRVLWRRQASPEATEFVLCAIPLGGYIRMLDEREAPVDDRDLGQAFNRKPLWQRAAVVAAGPLANLLLATLIYAGMHWVGVEEIKPVLGAPTPSSQADRAGLRAGDWVRATSADGVDWQDLRSLTELNRRLIDAALRHEALTLMVSNPAGHGSRSIRLDLSSLGGGVDGGVWQRVGLGGPFSEPILGAVQPGEPGEKAGLRAGDRVLRIGDQPIDDGVTIRRLIRASVSGRNPVPMHWTVIRHGQTLAMDVTPSVSFEGDTAIGHVGLLPGAPPAMVTVRYGLWDGFVEAVTNTWDNAVLMLKTLGKMLIGEASLKNLSGPLSIASAAGQAMRLGLGHYLDLLAIVSVSLGVLNLLPLPVLDGGHLMYYLFEGVTGRPLSERWLERMQRGGVAIVLMMMSLALYNDVARFLGLQ